MRPTPADTSQSRMPVRSFSAAPTGAIEVMARSVPAQTIAAVTFRFMWPSLATSSKSLFEREDALPVLLHADDHPAVPHRLVIKLLREGSDLAVGKSLCRSIGIFTIGVVMEK